MDICKTPTKLTSGLAPELLLMIVRHVDDRQTLFSLLTTSRVLFDAAVRRLYLDPFECAEHSTDACMNLCKWILALSPSTKPEIEQLRTDLAITRIPHRYQPPPSQHPGEGGGGAGESPYVDYLSFVKHVEILFTGDHDFQVAVELKKMMLPVLPWAVCPDGRFGQLSTITIISAEVNAFLPTIPSMTKLRTVIWDPTPYHKRRDMSGIRRFVETYVAAHGERGRKLVMYFETCEDGNDDEVFDEIDGVIPDLVDIYRLLDPFPPTKRSIVRGNSWMRCLAHKDRMDFGNIQEIDVNFDVELELLLPRFHKLESLRCEDGLISTRIFQWAVEELDQALRLQGSEGQSSLSSPLLPPPPSLRQLSSIPPLRKIDLFVDRAVIATTMRDIRTCFYNTIESVELCFTSATELFVGFLEAQDQEPDELSTYVNGARVLRVGSEWSVPKLQHLRLYGTDTRCFVSVDPNMTFSETPNLETLVFGDSSSLHEDPEELFHDEEHTPELVDDNMIRMLNLEPCCPWNLPKLRELGLRGAAAAQFHPDTLAYTTELEDLSLNMRPVYVSIPSLADAWGVPTSSSSSSSSSSFGFGAQETGPLDHWRWPLPKLKRLFLSGCGAYAFTIRALKMLPALEQLTLVVSSDKLNGHCLTSLISSGTWVSEKHNGLAPSSPRPTAASPFEADTNDMDMDVVSGDDDVDGDGYGYGGSETTLTNGRMALTTLKFPQLRHLYLKGHWRMNLPALLVLLRRFPQLQEVWLTSVPWKLVDEKFVQLGPWHPSLKLVWITTVDCDVAPPQRMSKLLSLQLLPISRRPVKETEGFTALCVDHDWFLVEKKIKKW